MDQIQLPLTIDGQVPNLVCFSHLRWDFVYQRPQHLMSRFAKDMRVFFVEEPHYHADEDKCIIKLSPENVWIVTPHLKENADSKYSIHTRQKKLLQDLFRRRKIESFIAWYYTPMALKFTSDLKPAMVIYDCMDELANFKFAPAELKILEAELFSRADVVFTGGHTLYQAKKNSHHNIYPYPSSIDKQHFSKARTRLTQPHDQSHIPSLKFGFYGVLDERFDIDLIAEVAVLRPEWQFIMVGPVVKINVEDLPKRDNIHYLGGKSYAELPTYLSGWDFAVIPFQRNESTKFISPTKTPEYLAAGKPVISTSIADVVTPYGKNRLVYIADTAEQFIAAAESELKKDQKAVKQWLRNVDTFLADNSWNNTVAAMRKNMQACLRTSSTLQVNTGLKSVA